MTSQPYEHSEDGAVTVETSLIITFLILLTVGLLECGLGLWQWNSAQQAARHGARLAATSDPVAQDLNTMTGLGNGIEAGDPFPEYERVCSGLTNSCNMGEFNQAALTALLYGPDGDLTCANTTRGRRGICDVVSAIRPQNIDISYMGSGLGRAGNPAKPAPLITVTIRDLEFDFIFLDAILPGTFQKIPPVSVSVMSEDLRSQTQWAK